MAIRRVDLPALEYEEDGATRVMVPVRSSNGWCVCDTEGASYWKNAADVRRFAAEWLEEAAAEADVPDQQPYIDVYLALANLLDEILAEKAT